MYVLFLSTPSARRATTSLAVDTSKYKISIHALREEGDRASSWAITTPSNFYPRPPRGGRHALLGQWKDSENISIHALREEGDRRALVCKISPGAISIHALREEGDQGNAWIGYISRKFLSTPSARRATQLSHHSPSMTANFYPRPPRGGRHLPAREENQAKIFLSTPSARRATIKPLFSRDSR